MKLCHYILRLSLILLPRGSCLHAAGSPEAVLCFALRWQHRSHEMNASRVVQSMLETIGAALIIMIRGGRDTSGGENGGGVRGGFSPRGRLPSGGFAGRDRGSGGSPAGRGGRARGGVEKAHDERRNSSQPRPVK